VISHAHPDHVAGLVEIAKARGEIPLPTLVHPDAFLPRYIDTPFGWVVPAFTLYFNKKECEEAGVYFVETGDPVPVGPAAITTGEIPWSDKVPFEPPGTPHPITLRQVKDGKFNVDKTVDDSALIINLKGKGLVVITGCAHAGVINTILRAQELTGVQEVYAIIGGFHLGFVESPDENIPKTIEALKQFNPTIVCPMHCSGFKLTAAMSREMPQQFVISNAGTQITLPIPG
jgi:7,8-dihydropterin-6-yl-methyl-4-(beta-D-ribofuranosyl)aminobenzene 5'-phosphate synthase